MIDEWSLHQEAWVVFLRKYFFQKLQVFMESGILKRIETKEENVISSFSRRFLECNL